ncbi:GTP cyclohydrolase II [Nocardioides okcheonensis]|uniref:GTP cyclohydrolase II n=1 Tax=Nocardioides okcheonensis TaxID=2894081 RepID=UPI001E464672|nr:GTP cyclohydrolase II [Nocardioides okcheonensis]UFN44496.1 GTP cyclohydrolase II [Nocardioides okcheonensis]
MSTERVPDLPAASVRRDVALPLVLADGSTVPARMSSFDGLLDGREHVAIALGDRAGVRGAAAAPVGVPLVRVHSECLTGDVLGSARCDCGPQLREAVSRIAAIGGHLLYLRQEGRGIGLYNKLDAYALQEQGLDTFEANRALGFDDDERDYAVAAQMLRALGVDRVVLLSNNPDKAAQLAAYGIGVERRDATLVHRTDANDDYLRAKARGGHLLGLP